eukprot:GHUV01004692.1.p1 GENE.GHUV01004692.1~~GHUV01004692.1.p1  ORF type:complete len:249 (+),score=59.85 GHUV01004692.1:276-1022(+)
MAALGSKPAVATATQPHSPLRNIHLRQIQQHTRSRGIYVAAALPRLADLAKLFSAGQQQQQRNRFKEASQELLDTLTNPTKSQQQRDRRARIDQLLDELLTCQGVPFNEQSLSGGPWLVLYTRGTAQLWKATYQAGKAFNTGNAASQDLNPNGRTVVNKAEYAGDKLYVTASGTYQPLEETTVLPIPVQANISSGLLHLFGLDIPLPIRGTGRFDVVYLDDKLRVFRSGGAISVQVKQQYLETVEPLQ